MRISTFVAVAAAMAISVPAAAERGVSADACTPQAISCNSTVNGVLDSSDCALNTGTSTTITDDWRFTGSAGQQVTITMRSTVFDTYLYLIGPTGSTVGSNDDLANGDTNSRVTATLPTAGEYRIYASRFAGTGAYTLELTCSGTQPPAGQTLSFIVVSPCRQHDTRGASGPRLAHQSTRQFKLTGAPCGIPEDAKAVSANVTITNNQTGYLSIWPVGGTQPGVSTLNYQAGGQYALANAAILPLGTNGSVNIFAEGSTDVIIDVNGYFK